MSEFIHSHTFIKYLDRDSAIFKLLKEIETIVQFPIEPFLNRSMVIHYLKEYRVRRPIGKDSIDSVPFPKELLLKQKISSLHETDIYWLCNELARMHPTKKCSAEKVANKTLYVFLDEFLKDVKKTKRPKKLLPGYLYP